MLSISTIVATLDVVKVYPGARLALLLLGSFDAMVDEVEDELARRGHPGVTTTLEFAVRAIAHGGHDASELGRRLGVTKQSAARTIATLEQLGYVERGTDPADGRRKALRVTARGYELDAIGGQTFDRLRNRWQRQLGTQRVAEIEQALLLLAGGEPRSAEGFIAGSRVSDGS